MLPFGQPYQFIMFYSKVLTLYCMTKNLSWSKLRAFANNKLDLFQMTKLSLMGQKMLLGGKQRKKFNFQHFFLFIRLSKTGRIMGSPMAGWRAASTSLSGAYLQNYSSYGYEISWVDRSHQGGVQCAGIITLAFLIFQ